MRIVLGVTGGIAAYKAVHVLRGLRESGHDVTVVPTKSALKFVGAPTWEALAGHAISTEVWDGVAQVRHIEIGQNADLVLVAPATANFLAKTAHGLADDLLTGTLLATTAPIAVFPAMHTEMWLNAATQSNVETLRARGITVVDPASGRLTGSDSGPGRLPEPDEIISAGLAVAGEDLPHKPLFPAGTRITITAGGTREPIDPVRFIGNHSSGKMGHALAVAAAEVGAEVHLISTVPAETLSDDNVHVTQVDTAAQMQEAVFARPWDVLIMAAAVADYRPDSTFAHKIKKNAGGIDSIRLVANPDILRCAVTARESREAVFSSGEKISADATIIGFAAETGDTTASVVEYAQQKLARKGADLLIANEVGPGVTFGQDSSAAWILQPSQPPIPLQYAVKSSIAKQIISYLSEYRTARL